MSAARRRRVLEIWPAFVDATASLLMVVVFVLLVAAVGQQFLTLAISGRDQALNRLTAQVNDLSALLSMQESESARLRETLTLRSASLAKAEADLGSERAKLAEQTTLLDERGRLIEAQTRELETRERRLGDLTRELSALEALRDRIRQELETTLSARDDISRRLAAESAANLAAQAQAELLNRQLEQVRQQLAELAHALEVRDGELARRDLRIAELGSKLNVALANQAARLQRYRSEFFGRLRDALADVPGVQIVGDRFVLPAGLLFASGSDELGSDGRRQVAQIARTLERIVREIPPDIDWILRIDGHTDRRPIHTERFPSNWELSAARAIGLARELMRYGVPSTRLAAAGFAEFHPLDDGEDDAALARNRRIELKLTSR